MDKVKFDKRSGIHQEQLAELREHKASNRPYRLPHRLHAHALTKCPTEPSAKAKWLADSEQIIHRVEGHIHDQGHDWDWDHFVTVVVPWAIEAWQNLDLTTPHNLQDFYGLTSWLGTWLYWCPVDVAPRLEPLARALCLEARKPSRGPWCPLHGESDAHPIDEHPASEWYKHVVLDIDAWEQKSGIDLGIPHGAQFVIVNAADRAGWKKPRLHISRVR